MENFACLSLQSYKVFPRVSKFKNKIRSIARRVHINNRSDVQHMPIICENCCCTFSITEKKISNLARFSFWIWEKERGNNIKQTEESDLQRKNNRRHSHTLTTFVDMICDAVEIRLVHFLLFSELICCCCSRDDASEHRIRSTYRLFKLSFRAKMMKSILL